MNENEESSIQEVKHGKEVKIDYLTVTFEFRSNDSDMELEDVEEYVNMFAEVLSFPKERITEKFYGKGNYRYVFDFGESIQLKLCGPLNEMGIHTNSLELKGEGCREFERLNGVDAWPEFLLFLYAQLDGSFTRIDIPTDDFDGTKVNFEYLKDKIDRGMYTSAFKKEPVIHGSKESGYSLTFGQRKANSKISQQLCIYEKDKEQRAKGNTCDSEYWTRYEMRFMHQKAQRVVEAILDVYFQGVIKGPTKREVPKNDEGFLILVSSLLYGMLDIKEDTDYDETNLSKAPTDPKWKEFVESVEKAKIPSPGVKEPSWNRFSKYVNQTLPLYSVTLLVKAGYNLEQYQKLLLQELNNNLDVIIDDTKKLNKVNVYASEIGLNQTDIDLLKKSKEQLEDKLLDEELPF